MVLAELWEFSQAEEGKGCGEKQRETFLNLEWQGVSLEWSYCPSCHWGESLSKEQPCEQGPPKLRSISGEDSASRMNALPDKD